MMRALFDRVPGLLLPFLIACGGDGNGGGEGSCQANGGFLELTLGGGLSRSLDWRGGAYDCEGDYTTQGATLRWAGASDDSEDSDLQVSLILPRLERDATGPSLGVLGIEQLNADGEVEMTWETPSTCNVAIDLNEGSEDGASYQIRGSGDCSALARADAAPQLDVRVEGLFRFATRVGAGGG